MRTLLPVLLLLACAGGEPPSPADGSAAAPDAAVAALSATLQRTAALTDSIEAILRPLPLMRPGDVAALRRYLNDDHVASARALGVRVRDSAHITTLVEEGALVPLEDSTRFWVVRDVEDAFVVPHTAALLEEIGRRFQARLADMGLPPYRLEITSALRTAEDQAALRGGNPNAAAGVSSHEFGTTVDIVYTSYPPPEALPSLVPGDAPAAMQPLLRQVARTSLAYASARRSLELRAVLGEVLREAQADGIVRVIFEELQPVYHVTVSEALAG